MQVIEKITQLEELQLTNIDSCYIVPIMVDNKKHYLNNSLSLLYLNCDDREFMLCFDHSESLSLSLDCLNDYLKFDTIYVPNKNELDLDNLVDVSMLYYLNTGKPLELNFDTDTHQYFERKYYRFNNINKLIPIYKHLEYCRKFVDVMKRIVDVCSIDDVFEIYNNDVLDNFKFIESSGLCVDKEKLPVNYQRHITNANLVHTQYNPFTSTGRPSNKYGGINFGALNKSDGSREPFISRFNNGLLVEMDYDAYHLRLIADIIGYDFPSGSVHKYLGEQYGVDYEESKKLSFKYLYGGIPTEISQNIPFFKLVEKYIDFKWNEYNTSFSVKSDIYNRVISKKNLIDMNPNKLFNYLIQLNETEYNMKMLSNLTDVVEPYKSKLILYQYDSFLFDFCLDDGKDFLQKVRTTIEQNGKFPVKVAKGINYHEIKDITEKLNVC
tara:strand:- start:2458 stop:3774 length:1317 start_codon:yes stop_codon:yes gene_type:complete